MRKQPELRRSKKPVLWKYWLIVGVAVAMVIGCAGTGTADTGVSAYDNPVALQRADPWIYRHSDGYYYFIATVPEYDRIELRRARTINELTSAPTKVIWRQHQTGPMGAHIWAPELHYINGAWYIYFAAGDAEQLWNIRMYVLSNTALNPMAGGWREEGRIETPQDSFSLDATSFRHKGKRYLLWAQADPEKDTGTSILLAEMNSATAIKPPVIRLSSPEFGWETVGYKVNEGPAVIKRNGRIFVTYSASATDHNYAVGLLWADVQADLLDPAVWHKSPEPVFYTNDEVGRFGPGHNSFTVAEDGVTDLMIYHGRDYRDIKGDPLNDPNRHTRVRQLYWDEQGMPDFRQRQRD